jgi:hypothetical protein
MVDKLQTVSEETVDGAYHADLLMRFQTLVKGLRILENAVRVVVNKEYCVARGADQER